MIRLDSFMPTVCSSVAMLVITTAALTCPTASATTMENLQTAFKGESNAHARYLAFAKQADKEGYGEVASLFRAAARAEQVHAMNHAEVIGELRGVAKADVQEPVVKTTRENLQESIGGESYERDTMYPSFLRHARSDRNTRAIRTLNLAKSAESEHARLFADALSNLERLKGSKSVTHYVCPVCGFTARETNFKECPSCFTSKDDFEKAARVTVRRTPHAR